MFKKCLNPSFLSLYFILSGSAACLEKYFICFLKKTNNSYARLIKTTYYYVKIFIY